MSGGRAGGGTGWQFCSPRALSALTHSTLVPRDFKQHRCFTAAWEANPLLFLQTSKPFVML